MKQWIPTNKATGVVYPPITEAEKLAYEADPVSKGKYTFKAIEVTTQKESTSKPTEKKEKAPAPAPIEAKAVKVVPEGEE